MNRFRIAVAASVTLVASLATTLSGSPAQAAQYDCSIGLMCVWKDASFANTRFDYNTDVNSMVGTNVGNDAVSSAFNRGTVSTRLWQNIDCTGSNSQTITAGVAKAQVQFNDNTSSLDVYTVPACGF